MLKFQRSSLPLSALIQNPNYQSLILPSILPHLISSEVTHWVAIEAWQSDELVGLSLSEIYPLSKTGQLFSLFVKASHRRQGIGRQLFRFTQDLLVQEEQAYTLEILYEQTSPFTPALEKILTSAGWSVPNTLLLIRCHFDVKIFNPPWLHYPIHLPQSMTLFPWKELLPKDREHINYLTQQGRFLPYLSPLRQEESNDLETSMGLRQHEKVIGWCVTQRPDPLTVQYSKLYIDSDLLHSGYGIQLLAESIRRQKQLHIPRALFEVNLKEIDPSWWRFVRKRLMPRADQVERLKRARRLFASSLK